MQKGRYSTRCFLCILKESAIRKYPMLIRTPDARGRSGIPAVTNAVPVSPRKTSRAKLPGVFWFLVFVTLLALGTAGHFYMKYQQSEQTSLTPALEMQKIIGIIDRSIALPQDETPVLATVSDISRLAGKKFFEKAENGDKILVYTEAAMAYLYRPAIQKVINISQLSPGSAVLGESQLDSGVAMPASATAAQEESPRSSLADQPVTVSVLPIRIALYNGSTQTGVLDALEQDIKAAFQNVEVTLKDKAAKNDYQGTIIVDISGKNSDLAKSLAEKSLDGIVGSLPVGEAAPQADILVIAGN